MISCCLYGRRVLHLGKMIMKIKTQIVLVGKSINTHGGERLSEGRGPTLSDQKYLIRDNYE